MNEVIRQIQAQRDDCVSELWNPQAADNDASDDLACWDGTDVAEYANPLDDKVGDLTIPRTLFSGFSDGDDVRITSGRDSDNNIIVYWGA